MTDSALLAAVVLMALVAGALIPVLYQLYRTLKRTRELLESAGPKLERALDQIGDAVARIDRVGATLEEQAPVLARVLGVASSVALAVQRARQWLHAAASAGPALLTGARLLFSRDRSGRPRERSAARGGLKIPFIRRYSRIPQ